MSQNYIFCDTFFYNDDVILTFKYITEQSRSDYGGQSILLGYQKMKDRLIAENICKTDTTVRPRKDEYLYNMDCVSEALVNMLVHNDRTITEPLVASQ